MLCVFVDENGIAEVLQCCRKFSTTRRIPNFVNSAASNISETRSWKPLASILPFLSSLAVRPPLCLVLSIKHTIMLYFLPYNQGHCTVKRHSDA